MIKLYEFFKEQLDSKIENHNLRTLREYCPLDAVRVKRDDKEYLMNGLQIIIWA